MKAIIALLITLIVVEPALAQCEVTSAFTFQSKLRKVQIYAVTIPSYPGRILQYRAASAINTDGSAISYNLDGTAAGALNSMCNGTNAILADGSTYSGVVTDAERKSTAYQKMSKQQR